MAPPILTSIYQAMKKTAVASLKFCFDASFAVEKITWISFCLFGTCLIFIQLNKQVNSWQENPTLTTRHFMDLSQIDFPAVTFCPRGNARMNVAERLIPLLPENSTKFKELNFLLHKAFTDRYYENLRSTYDDYKSSCLNEISRKFFRHCLTYEVAYKYALFANQTLPALINALLEKMIEMPENASKNDLLDGKILKDFSTTAIF